jgi:hypothetical protein
MSERWTVISEGYTGLRVDQFPDFFDQPALPIRPSQEKPPIDTM